MAGARSLSFLAGEALGTLGGVGGGAHTWEMHDTNGDFFASRRFDSLSRLYAICIANEPCMPPLRPEPPPGAATNTPPAGTPLARSVRPGGNTKPPYDTVQPKEEAPGRNVKAGVHGIGVRSRSTTPSLRSGQAPSRRWRSASTPLRQAASGPATTSAAHASKDASTSAKAPEGSRTKSRICRAAWEGLRRRGRWLVLSAEFKIKFETKREGQRQSCVRVSSEALRSRQKPPEVDEVEGCYR